MSAPVTREDLQPGERVRVWRLRVGLSRAKAGKLVGVSGYTWGEFERGVRPFPQDLPWTGAAELRSHERCLVMRLRSGQGQAHVAAELDLSRFWVGQMERGREDSTRLEQYWEI